MAASETCVGTIKALDAQAGWGSIECAQTRPVYDKDVLFQAADLNGRQVSGGEIVTFQVASVSGSPVALNLQFLQPEAPAAPPRPPPPPPPPPPPALGAAPGLAEAQAQAVLLAVQGGSYVGCVKNYNPLRGWGFIECPETGQALGKDIFFLKSELGGDYQASRGDVVSFQITQGKNGPMAQSVVFLNAAASAAPQGLGLYSGSLKTYNQEKGWGFIECDATRTLYGKDIFVLSSEFKGIPVGEGQQLTFSVTQGSKGPIASDVQVIGADGLPVSAPKSLSSEQLCGVVRSWDEVEGHGLITGEGVASKFGGVDVPFSRGALGGKPVFAGDQVRFGFTQGDQGPVAHEVEVLPSGCVVSSGCPGQVYTGHVKSYFLDKGWGFVTSDETSKIFGKDIFIHRREIPEGLCPAKGHQVSFSVQLNSTGRPEATRVSFPGAGLSAALGAGLASAGAAELALLQLAALSAPASDLAAQPGAPAAAAGALSPMPPQADLSFLGLGAAATPAAAEPAQATPPDPIAALAAMAAAAFAPAPPEGAAGAAFAPY